MRGQMLDKKQFVAQYNELAGKQNDPEAGKVVLYVSSYMAFFHWAHTQGSETANTMMMMMGRRQPAPVVPALRRRLPAP